MLIILVTKRKKIMYLKNRFTFTAMKYKYTATVKESRNIKGTDTI